MECECMCVFKLTDNLRVFLNKGFKANVTN